jgi:hypothetical protein
VNIGARPKAILIVLIVLGLLTYLVIVDFGINAGRIHRGVEVAGLNVGGLTPGEAEEALRERADTLKYSLIDFRHGPVVCRFTPLEVGWDPREDDTAMAAREIGREENVWRALSDRLSAWVFGTKVHWRARTDASKMRSTITSCERRILARHHTIDKVKFRKRIRRAIVQWPRKTQRIPLADVTSSILNG